MPGLLDVTRFLSLDVTICYVVQLNNDNNEEDSSNGGGSKRKHGRENLLTKATKPTFLLFLRWILLDHEQNFVQTLRGSMRT